MLQQDPRKVSLAPMLDWTDRHFRYLLRLVSRHMWLYTEMVTTGAILHGNNLERFLGYSTAEQPLMLAKKALLREIGKPNPDAESAELEKEILKRINNLGIGPMGYGGRVTALAVHVEVSPTHIASLPVAVNLQCHSARHKEAIL